MTAGEVHYEVVVFDQGVRWQEPEGFKDLERDNIFKQTLDLETLFGHVAQAV